MLYWVAGCKRQYPQILHTQACRYLRLITLSRHDINLHLHTSIRRSWGPGQGSCDLERGGRDAVALGPRAEAVPLLHGSALGLQEPPPVWGLRRARGELPDNDAAHKVIAALHVVAVNWIGGLESNRRCINALGYVLYDATQNVTITCMTTVSCDGGTTKIIHCGQPLARTATSYWSQTRSPDQVNGKDDTAPPISLYAQNERSLHHWSSTEWKQLMSVKD